jgi:hypothetical protein
VQRSANLLFSHQLKRDAGLYRWSVVNKNLHNNFSADNISQFTNVKDPALSFKTSITVFFSS